MPIKWQCPGNPKCQKIFQYGQGLKAHMSSCKHAQSKRARKKKEEMETIISIIQFVEDRQRGNITIARIRVPDFIQPQVLLSRV